MNYGFVRGACCTPSLTVGDTHSNALEIIKESAEAYSNKASLIVFPELCITGYTCSDLFLQDTLLSSSIEALKEIIAGTKEINAVISVGLPLSSGNALYNVAAILFKGKVIAIVPKSYIPNYAEFYERRHFMPWTDAQSESVSFGTDPIFKDVPVGSDIIIQDSANPNFRLGFELCEDLWVPLSPSTKIALSGATVIANLSGSNEIIGKAQYRRTLVSAHSAKNICAYLYANAGNGESTTDLVFSGHSLIAENGTILAEKKPFKSGILYADIDLERICHERIRTTTFQSCAVNNGSKGTIVWISTGPDTECSCSTEFTLNRFISPSPFVPSDSEARKERCEEVIELQAQGLAKRLRHTHAKSAVIGLSGGLDSTLALLVTCRAFDLCGMDRKNIQSITMPCFGTTDRTYNNACILAEKTGSTLKEVRIADAVKQHFKDIGQDESVHDVTYENCQARERTQVLMDIANKSGGLVIGTGDLSEQALGWATYNGDHMSMYGVNGSIPKTLVRYLVKWFADEAADSQTDETAANKWSEIEFNGISEKVKDSAKVSLSDVLYDILDTPVSPELLPPDGKNIAQKTEDLVGPYELHDFFLYYVLRFGFSPKKIYFLAKQAFIVQPEKSEGKAKYSEEIIKKWLTSFYRRFFQQQFKRSCMPDGAKVGTVNLSPRGDWRMPSDASAAMWLKECEEV
ncbi:MAG: NAD(+) synthase [Treponema sp.]|nr:NAD(+) synthase [Candidatus Treponema equifaecale]